MCDVNRNGKFNDNIMSKSKAIITNHQKRNSKKDIKKSNTPKKRKIQKNNMNDDSNNYNITSDNNSNTSDNTPKLKQLQEEYTKSTGKSDISMKTEISSNSLTNAYIIIKPKESVLNEQLSKMKSLNTRGMQYINEMIRKFMIFMNSHIGSDTETNYCIQPVQKNIIRIPLHAYLNNEIKMSPIELLEKRRDIILSYWESFNWSSVNNMKLWIARSLFIFGIDVSNLFEMSFETPNFEYDNQVIDLYIKKPTIKLPKIKRFVLHDKSIITFLIDPYLTDYGLFQNLSVDFDEMGMSYNALHLYEHLLTKPWVGLNAKDLLNLNGTTYPTGVCYVYTIHATPESLKLYFESSVKWLCDRRIPNGWNDIDDQITLEVKRTISETRTERTLSTFGRSDLNAYDCKYNKNIFNYWSNRPMEFLISIRSEDEINQILNESALNEYIKSHERRKIKRPEDIIYKTLPLDVIKMKHNSGYFTRKVSKESIKKNVQDPYFDTDAFYGRDCIMKSELGEDLSIYNNVLFPLLFDGDMFTESELNEYLHQHNIPYSSSLYSSASLQMHNGWYYMDEICMDAIEL